MVKINNISVTGLRGVRNSITIPLNTRSALFYGDNGSGKSTLSDVFEWFFFDKVEHLSDEEIGKKGYEALRNIFLNNNDSGSIFLEFTNADYSGGKLLEIKKNSLKSTYSNSSNEFIEYLETSKKENLILRYKDLVTFVLSTKSDKLRALSDIIGYSQVTHVRDTFLTVFNSLSKEIKTKNFDGQINFQQGQIMEQFGQNVTSDENFIAIVEELVKPFALDIKIERLNDVNEILRKIKTPDDSKALKQETFLIKIEESLVNLPVNLDELEDRYKDYKNCFDGIVADIEKLKKLIIEKILTAGHELLSDESYVENNCPLCLTEKNKAELLSDIKARITELTEIKNEQKKLKDLEIILDQQITTVLQILQMLLHDKQINEEDNNKHKKNIETLINGVNKYKEQIKVIVAEGSRLEDEDKILVNRELIKLLNDDCKVQLEAIKNSRKKHSKSDAHGKINIAGHAYALIRQLKAEKSLYEKQRDTMEAVYLCFLEKQKEALETFLENLSEKINEIYQFLNPGEKVENIKLIPLTKDDELSGITIQFDFLENKNVTPPHKLLSESHLNCLGIAFFLASVEAFNKENKFIVLDDVISSFDANHRKRFADLLVEKYHDYQIILLTHEKTWFDIVKNLVQRKNWTINTLKHNELKGTYIDEAPQTLRERIERKILDGNENNLGNEARKYLEDFLKQIAFHLEVKVSYRFNDINEDRMAFELLNALKSTLKKRKCTELLNNSIIDRLLGSLFIGNKDSHANSAELKFNDMKAFWIDVTDFEQLIFCEGCKSPLSIRNYDKVNKKIRCSKGEIEYSWSE